MKYPFLVILTPFILGIVMTEYVKINLFFILLIFLLLLLYLYYIIIYEKLNQILLCLIILMFFLLGIVQKQNNSYSYLSNLTDKELRYRGKVIEKKINNKDKLTYILEIDQVNKMTCSKEKTILNIWQADNLNLGLGDSLEFKSSSKKPLPNTNPKLFNYKKYLASKKIFTQNDIDLSQIIKIEKNIDSLVSKKSDFRSYIDFRLGTYLKGDNYKLVKSIILGESSYLDEKIRESYNNLGLAHILAVSGLHIGIISSFLLFVLQKLLGLDKNLSRIITIVLIWIYAYLIDFPPSILRGGLVCSFIYLSKIIHRPYFSINILSLSMFILLWINPLYIYNLSFKLSFLASYSLVILTPQLKIFFHKYNKKIQNLLSPILAVNIGVLPIDLYYFNSFKFLTIFANIIILPIISIGLNLSFILLLCPSLFLNLLDFLAFIINKILDFQFLIISYLDSFSINKIDIFSPSIYLILSYYIALALIVNRRNLAKISKKYKRILLPYLIFIIFLNFFNIFTDETLSVYFVDVGQGDCAILNYKNKNILIDTGGTIYGDFKIGQNISLPILIKHGIRSVDGVFISHFHYDHYEAIFDMVGKLKIKNIFIPYECEDIEFLEVLNKYSIPVSRIYVDSKIKIDDNLSMEIVWPEEKYIDILDDNNKSMNILLKYRDKKILFTGDIEEEAEKILSDKLSDIDILKVPHHGSSTSSSLNFIEKLNPKIGLISVGRNNRFNHPSRETIERFNSRGTKIFRTDRDGLVKISIDKKTYKVETYTSYLNSYPKDLEKIFLDNKFILLIYCIYFVIICIMIRSICPKEEDLFCITVTL